MTKKLAFLSCLALLLGLVAPNVGHGVTLDLKISGGTNDAEEHLTAVSHAAGAMDVGSSDLEMPYEDDGTPKATDLQLTCLRYNVALAKGTKINKAYVEFTVDEPKGGTKPVNLIIEGQLAVNPPAFASTANNLSSRTPWTKAQVKWAVENWTAANSSAGQKSKTPDVTAILQEIINQDGWASGNALVLAFRDDPASPSTGLRCADAYEDGPALAPVLHVEAFSPEAKNPDPANGAQEITSPMFQWTGGDGALTHQVYLGTKPELGPADKAGAPMPLAMYYHIPGLTPGVTYYWRVDEIAADGKVTAGPVWSFSVMPLTAHFPSPYDGARWRKTNTTVSWTAGQVAVSHKVYGGTDKAAVTAGAASALLATQVTTSLDVSAVLKPAATYYWRVDEVDSTGAVAAGPVWTFSTADPAGGAVAEYWDNMTLSGKPKVVKTVPGVNFDWGDGAAKGVNSPDPNIPTDQFSCRWSAELNVPVSGKYRIYEASDDGARAYLNGAQILAGWVDRGTTEDTSAELDLVAGQRYLLVMEMYENGGGAAAFLRWSGPGIPKEIIPQGALMPPQMAFSLTPSNGSVDVDAAAVLSWSAGAKAVGYNVYLSTNKALVAAGDASVRVAQQKGASFAPAKPFDRGTTNYWKVDVVTADNTIIPGLVSSFRIADRNTTNWAIGAQAAGAKYLNTFVPDGLYDIGTFGGEQTYEFVVRGNPDEKEASQCLIGRRDIGDTKVGLKYEQWNNTKTYGATVFGVLDYDFKVPNAPGEYTHLAFVSSAAAKKTDLYVNGVLKGSIATAITLSGQVGIGYGAQNRPPADPFFDNFDGDIYGVAVYNKLLSANEIAANADKYFKPIAITDADLLLYYDFATGAGNLAVDQSGHSNHGLFMGKPKWATGLWDGCLSLDIATLDYVQTTAPLNIKSNTVSVTGWVKHDKTPAAWSGILTHRGTSPGCLGLQHNGSEGPKGAELRYMWGADVYWDFSSGLVVPNGEWYFAALTISPTQGKLYLNGVDKTATNKAAHEPTNFDSLIRVGRDHQDNRIMTCLIDEVRFYKKTLTDVDIQRHLLWDITAAGDVVQGVPNDGDWPAAETPALAIDDKTSTKFLHRKGGKQPTGIQVTPAVGSTIVTALTFTTANDDYGRDPVKFELSGSNAGINGPWTKIAAGDIVDFAQTTLWPRFTRNATAISFQNTVAYKHYQVLFPSLRPNNDGLMQIAEVELLGVAAK